MTYSPSSSALAIPLRSLDTDFIVIAKQTLSANRVRPQSPVNYFSLFQLEFVRHFDFVIY